MRRFQSSFDSASMSSGPEASSDICSGTIKISGSAPPWASTYASQAALRCFAFYGESVHICTLGRVSGTDLFLSLHATVSLFVLLVPLPRAPIVLGLILSLTAAERFFGVHDDVRGPPLERSIKNRVPTTFVLMSDIRYIINLTHDLLLLTHYKWPRRPWTAPSHSPRLSHLPRSRA